MADHDHYYTFENLHLYDEVNPGWKPYFQYRIVTADLAISQEDTADYTAILSADIYKVDDEIQIYILPNPINRRMEFHEICNTLETIGLQKKPRPFIFVEDTGFQRVFSQELMSRDTIAIAPFSVKGMSKRERLSLTVLWHQHGQIHFPRTGVEALLNQLTGFGREKHDDLLDAYTMLVMQVQEFVRTHTEPVDPDQPPVIFVRGGIQWPTVSYGDKKMDFKTLKDDPLGWDN